MFDWMNERNKTGSKLRIGGVTNRLERGAFEEQYLAKPSKESIEKYERAFEARLAYEKNCIAKYDYPDFMNKPSRPPKKGERIGDYAMRYGTTVKEMKDCLPAVERALDNGL